MPRGKRSEVGDTRIAPNGYHYTKTPTGWEGTGRLIAAEKLGRPLEKNERIRYLDGDQLNFDPDNIVIYVTREQSNSKKLAALYAKRDEIEAQIAELENEDG